MPLIIVSETRELFLTYRPISNYYLRAEVIVFWIIVCPVLTFFSPGLMMSGFCNKFQSVLLLAHQHE